MESARRELGLLCSGDSQFAGRSVRAREALFHDSDASLHRQMNSAREIADDERGGHAAQWMSKARRRAIPRLSPARANLGA